MIKAPYNFVPLAQKVVFPEWGSQISIDSPFEDGISGTISVRYTAQTPVFVGNGKNDNGNIDNYKAANGKFAIPGSSLRGMFRNVIEIASFGKFNRVSDAALSVRDLTNAAKKLYRSHFTNKSIKGGWLIFENAGWVVYPVEYKRIEDSDIEKYCELESGALTKREDSNDRINKLHNDVAVFFSAGETKVSRIKKTEYTGSVKGFIVLTGNPGGKKHLDFVFEDKGKQKITVDYATILQFKQTNAPKAADQKKGLDLAKKLNDCKNIGYPGIPVFYLPDSNGNPESLGLSMMYRLPYKNSLHEAIRNSSEDNFSDKLDFAECMFGKIENTKTEKSNYNFSLRGRVQLEDAVTNSVALAQKVDTILSNPKPSFYPNYIQQDTRNQEYKTLMDNDVLLRGWKRYPVRNKFNIVKPNQDQGKQTSRFSPLQKGTVFEGKIHFHNLKKEELGLLLWAITWGNDKNLSHAVGMGKSCGFGQIRAEISSMSYLNNDSSENKYRTASVDEINSWIRTFESYMEGKVVGWKNCQQLKELKAMANPNNAERPKWDLAHMALENPIGKKEFVEAKKDFCFLSAYSEENQESHLSHGFAGQNPRTSFQNNSGYGNRQQQPIAKKMPHSEAGVANGSIQVCVLLEEKTKKGGWKARVKDTPEICGSIINTADVPTDKNAGDEIKLKVASVKGDTSSFRYEK